MAKKKKRNAKLNQEDGFLKALPQNILFVGEKGEEDKNIYISQSTYKEIHKFSENKTENECGGMLVGRVIEEFGKKNIIIHGFVEAKHSEGTPTTLKFTHETWEYVHSEIAKKYEGMKIVGWIHTHPNFGIFLSEYDKFIQTNFFSDENQIAFVVDPIQKTEGFYFWINGKIERCNGYYLFDRTGIKIDVANVLSDKEEKTNTSCKIPFVYPMLIGILFACIVVLSCFCLSLSSKINTLQKQQTALTESANNALASMQQQLQAFIFNNYNTQSSNSEAIDSETESVPSDSVDEELTESEPVTDNYESYTYTPEETTSVNDSSNE